MSRGRRLGWAPLAAGVLLALLLVLVLSGHAPEFRGLVAFDPGGLVEIDPAQVSAVEMRSQQETIALRREAGGWIVAGAGGPIPAGLGQHIDTGLRFLQVSKPVRDIPATELDPGSFAGFGLDPPASVVVLGGSKGPIATVHFGVLNPAGTSQYARLAGVATVHLLPRHVGNEWGVVADMARRLGSQAAVADGTRGADLLLPLSMAQLWAVEIVHAGKLTRFERDGAGSWFLHTGQHSHAGGTNFHTADPTQAQVIGAALAAFDEAAIEGRVAAGGDERQLAPFGLNLPPLIVLFYARDNSTPLARLEFGNTADRFLRYARLAPRGDVVTVAETEVRRITDLLKTVGAGS